MNNDRQTDQILAIDEKLTRDTFQEIWNGIDHLRISLLAAASHSAKIGLPDEQTLNRIAQAFLNLIAATEQAATKIRLAQSRRRAATTAKQPNHGYDPNNPRQRRKAPTTAKPAGSEKPHQNTPSRTKPHLRLGPPETLAFPSKQEPDANAQHVEDPPSTDNLHKLDRQLDTHQT